MVSGQEGRNQCAVAVEVGIKAVASMVSGHEDRNQAYGTTAGTVAQGPQWCPTRNAGIGSSRTAIWWYQKCLNGVQ